MIYFQRNANCFENEWQQGNGKNCLHVGFGATSHDWYPAYCVGICTYNVADWYNHGSLEERSEFVS